MNTSEFLSTKECKFISNMYRTLDRVSDTLILTQLMACLIEDLLSTNHARSVYKLYADNCSGLTEDRTGSIISMYKANGESNNLSQTQPVPVSKFQPIRSSCKVVKQFKASARKWQRWARQVPIDRPETESQSNFFTTHLQEPRQTTGTSLSHRDACVTAGNLVSVNTWKSGQCTKSS